MGSSGATGDGTAGDDCFGVAFDAGEVCGGLRIDMVCAGASAGAASLSSLSRWEALNLIFIFSSCVEIDSVVSVYCVVHEVKLQL